MPVCIECRYPIASLYTTYSRADDRSLGKGVRLTQCPRCKRFADKYVEHDHIVLFIDLVLIKGQVYRHLLFNRLGREDNRFDPSVIRLAILLLLFDVYLTWARIEKAAPLPIPPGATTSNEPSPLSAQPLVFQYLFFLLLCVLSTLAFHIPIRLLCAHPPRLRLPRLAESLTRLLPTSLQRHFDPSKPPPELQLFPHYPHPSPLSTALLVSSLTKLFPILLIIWDYDLPSSASAINYAVTINNVAALEILMDCGYLRAAGLVGVGAGCKALVGWAVLRCVGLSAGLGRGWGGWLGV